MPPKKSSSVWPSFSAGWPVLLSLFFATGAVGTSTLHGYVGRQGVSRHSYPVSPQAARYFEIPGALFRHPSKPRCTRDKEWLDIACYLEICAG